MANVIEEFSRKGCTTGQPAGVNESRRITMSATLGVGIYGAGHVSREHIRAYLKNPVTEVVAICSRTREGAADRASDFGLSATIYDDYDRMLANPSVQIVSICTPHALHAPGAIKAAQAGKHILV